MAIFGASYQIGRSALAAYQAAISVVGQNIANVGNADYTRQSARLAAMTGGSANGITPGGGVVLSELERHTDEAIEAQLLDANSGRTAAELRYQYISQVESIYNELSDGDLSTQMSEFFGSFGSIQTTPDDSGVRNTTIATANALLSNMQRQRSELVSQISTMNDTAAAAATEASSIAGEIADLNQRIVVEESNNQSVASALRDRRDMLLRDLSELIDVRVRYQDNGVVNVYAGSEALVEFNRSRGLVVERQNDGGVELATVRFADNNGLVDVTGGQLAGLVDTRDDTIVQQIEQLDQLAQALIYETNRIHSTGRGLTGMSSATGTYAVTDTDAALNSSAAGLSFPIENGSFIVHVRDTQTGQTITRQIEVDLDGITAEDSPDTSLASLAEALNEIPSLTASITADNRLALEAEGDAEFWFTEDSSGALAALGVGTFFTGTNAADIDVNTTVSSNPKLIAASLSGGTGDGTNAGKLSLLGAQASDLLGSQSLDEYHARMVNELAVAGAAAQSEYTATDTVYASLVAQREAISGVSLDEEVLNLTMYETAFQGASRYLTTINDLSQEILNLAL
ncbi:MAG: flagellar hook-associated protein FlgK [Phycisphaerae bacterium]|nr:flagellar hook-associated protein FlgK [Phycisphaerae bacterium]